MIITPTNMVGQSYKGKGLFFCNDLDLTNEYLKYYYEKSHMEYRFQNKFTFVCETDNFKPTDPKNYYVEDVEKAVDLLNSELLTLIGKKPVIEEIQDFLYQQNHLERGILSTNFSVKRTQLGIVETERFVEVLSKEIAIKFVKLAEITFNADIKISSADTNVRVMDKIIAKIDYMNYNQNVHPNIILLPTNIYNQLFEQNIKPNILTKTQHKIENIEVWINPHVKEVILYNNPYYLTKIPQVISKPILVFMSQILYGVECSKTEFYKSCLDLGGNKVENKVLNATKYSFRYGLVEVGFELPKNFCLIPVED